MMSKKFRIGFLLGNLIPILVFGQLKTFNISDFGAVGDSNTLNTTYIQAAIDSCNSSGGGIVEISSGTYLTGTLVLKSNVELHIESNATLLGSINHDDYPLHPLPHYRSQKDQAGGFYALIYAEEAENIALTGNGTINGQGKLQKPRPNPISGDIDGRPRNIMLISCKNIRVEGLHINNSGVWNQHYLNCENLVVNHINIYNHGNRNNDAIDIDGCRRVIISNSIFDSDDDGITLKSTGPAACEDVLISNCIVSSFCNAIKAGTESTGGFRNISISNCVIKPSLSKEPPSFNGPIRTGITGLSFIIVDGGIMEGIVVDNVTIQGTMAPIYIRLANRGRKYNPDAPQPGIGKLSNISISNVAAYGAGTWCSSITGLPNHPVQFISLNNVQLFSAGGIGSNDFNLNVPEDEKGYPQPTAWKNLPAYGLFIRHAQGISIHNLMIGTDSADCRVPVYTEDIDGLQIDGCQLFNAQPDTPFILGNSILNYNIKRPIGWNGSENDFIKLTGNKN